MTDKLNKKLKEIRVQKEKVKENFIALDGAEQMLMQLIEEENQTESEVVADATDNG